MRLSHLLLAAAMLLPFSTQAITLNKLEGTWKNADITCKESVKEDLFCEFVVKPKNKGIGHFQLVYKGKPFGRVGLMAVSGEDVWTVSLDGVALLDLEYEEGMLYDENDNKYYRVSK